MADYEIPETHDFPIIPSIMEGSMAHSTPFVAGEEFQSDMGFLLSLVTFFHLLGTLFFLPTLVFMVKPKFIMNKIAG